MKLLTGPDDKGVRLDHFLARQLENVTRSHIQLLNRSGAVHVDGRIEKSGHRLLGRESIEIELDAAEPLSLQPESIPLTIYYEDDDLAVLEKPAGLVVHPGSGIGKGTLVHALLYHFQSLSSFGGEARPGIVHRIDKWTSGLLVVARNNAAHAALGKSFENRVVEKRYTALVHGKVAHDSGVIETAISRHPKFRTRMAALAGRGRSAHTEYTVTERFREYTLLDVRIKTGRTHQIRVHLSAMGHPVVGDDVYGEKSDKVFTRKYGPLGRYFLHASFLRFPHPTKDNEMEFRSPLPDELQKFLVRIR